MHSKGKGASGSSKPHSQTPPEWSNSDKKEVEEIILQLSEEGNSNASIGTILRDKHGVPNVRLVTGKEFLKLWRDWGSPESSRKIS